VGYPQLKIYPRQLKNSGILPTINLRQPKYSDFQPTIYPRQPKNSGVQSTDFFKKHLKINRLDTRVFQLSRVYCQLWVSHPFIYPYPSKFSCSCMSLINKCNSYIININYKMNRLRYNILIFIY